MNANPRLPRNPHALLFVCLLVLGWTAPSHAEAPADLPDVESFNLWPGEAPGDPVYEGEVPETRRTDRGSLEFVHQPTLEVYHAKGADRTGAAVVICPGGGYRVLADRHEGTAVAQWLSRHGVTAVILRYRCFPYRHPVPMHDVQRAMQTVRANADKWMLDPSRIGVLGFSAGGHLASTAAVHHAPADPDADDPVERVSSRPDFAILIYPVITLKPPAAHMGSRRNLLGPEPADALVDRMSSDEQVDETTPPTFLVHAKDDKAVPIANSERFRDALEAHGVASELVVFDTGGHGFGLGRAGSAQAAWPGRCIDWLAAIGVMEPGVDE